MSVAFAYQILYSVALLVLGCLIALMLVRAVMGPRITDRLLSINMIGTMVIASLAILSQLLREPYLADVALIYAMISFISVLILSRTYIPAHPSRDAMGAGSCFRPRTQTELKEWQPETSSHSQNCVLKGQKAYQEAAGVPAEDEK